MTADVALQEEFPDVDFDVLRNADRVIKDAHGGYTTLAEFYASMRRAGNGDRFAALCSLRQAPRIMTDDVFWGGRKHFSEVYGERYASEVKQILASQGVHMTAHDEYCPELARFKGDKRAVINRADGRTGIKKRCEAMGLDREPESDPLARENCVPMADDLVAENAARMVREDSSASKLSKAELREAVIDKHGAKH